MAQAHKKKVYDWTRQEGVRAYIQEVSIITGIPASELIEKRHGGSGLNDTGTWAHRLIAIAFSKWLSPSFHVWCNQHLLELIETGITSIERSIPTKDELALTFDDYLDYLIKNREMLNKDKGLAKITLERIMNIL